jgi:hypothetical protein
MQSGRDGRHAHFCRRGSHFLPILLFLFSLSVVCLHLPISALLILSFPFVFLFPFPSIVVCDLFSPPLSFFLVSLPKNHIAFAPCVKPSRLLPFPSCIFSPDIVSLSTVGPEMFLISTTFQYKQSLHSAPGVKPSQGFF